MTQQVSFLEAIPFALQIVQVVRGVSAWRKRSSAGSTVVPAVGTSKDTLDLSPRSASYKPTNISATDPAPDTLPGTTATENVENV